MTNDSISDMLTRIRNACWAKHDHVFIMNTNINRSISTILKQRGYIKSLQIPKSFLKPIKLQLRYKGRYKHPLIKNLKRLSSPGLRKYSGYTTLPNFDNNIGIIVLSTSKGILTAQQARLYKVGGELLCWIS